MTLERTQTSGLHRRPSGPILAILLLACACASNGSAPSQDGEANVAPDINRNYKDTNIDVDRWARRFTGESREVFVSRFDILESLGLEPGTRIADIGAGTGLYTQLFAQAVGPEGKVFAVDISRPFLNFIAENAKAEGLTNIVTVQGEDRTARLPEAAVDVIFHCDTYHHFEYPKTLTADLARALVPGADMFVVDFERIPGLSSNFILGHVRAPKATVIAEIEASGFKLVEEIDLKGLKENYLLRFRKVATPER